MKKCLLQPAVAAAGLSLVCSLAWVGPLLSPNHTWTYHDCEGSSRVFLPVLFNMAGLWFGFLLLLLLAERHKSLRVPVWSGIIVSTPWILLEEIAVLFDWKIPRLLSVSILVVCAACWLAAAVQRRPSFFPIFGRVRRFTYRMLMFAGVCSFVILAQMFWTLWEARTLLATQPLHASVPGVAETRAQRPRVIWIILDELSYRQVYEQRFPSLNLPAFDQLADQATVFTQVEPAADSTEIAVPSLMEGWPVDRIQTGSDGTLRLLHNRGTGRWQAFHPQDTVFQDALNEGYRTGVAGWYNPYCRILAPVLDRCEWAFRQRDEGIPSDGSIASNIGAPWAFLAGRALRLVRFGKSDSNDASAAIHIADYRDIVSAGDEFLQDPSVDFLLLHVPIPHPGGIYDRRAGTFTTHGSSYIDNLALADKYLSHVRALLERRGEWDSAAVIVMGDHSWRTTLLWKGSTLWTPEDETASHDGHFDDRPAYIVKLPNETEAGRIDARFPAVKTRALLDGILNGHIRTVQELASFATQPQVQSGPPQMMATRAEGAAGRDRGQ